MTHNMPSHKNRGFFIRLALVFLVFGIAAFGVLFLPAVLIIIGQIMLGLTFVQMVELQHELVHECGVKKGLLNRIIGFMLGFPMLIVYADYQYNHQSLDMTTHCHDESNSMMRRTVLSLVSMWSYYKTIFHKMTQSFFSKSFYAGVAPQTVRILRRQYRILSLILFAMIFFVSYFHLAKYLLEVWLVPWVLVAVPMYALVDDMEQFGECHLNVSSVFRCTRGMRFVPTMQS